MKAAQYSEYGGPEVIKVNEVGAPALKEKQVLVQTQAATINPFDYKLRNGAMKDTIPLDFPVTIAADFSGVVNEIAEGATGFKTGDEVYGSANFLGGGSGALAELVAANAANIALKPTKLSHTEAAALVLVGVSAIQALDQLGLAAGKKVLIHGGAGGIGSTAIQYAKYLGAYVATAVREADMDFVKKLGADEVIDYERQQFEDVFHDYDAVFDTVSGDTYTRSFKVLKPGGIIISMNERPNEALAAEHGVTALFQSTKVTTESLNRLSEVVDKGIIVPQIDKTFPLEQAASAFTYMETGHPKGKVVVKIR
ncbi:MAG TPA: NADP-dependent oxidoreductase [Candidatus Saccharimonadales bacterium]|nr:NADP-dependent oxidoreductase [Candidatus Saccharimonadales bacterium]